MHRSSPPGRQPSPRRLTLLVGLLVAACLLLGADLLPPASLPPLPDRAQEPMPALRHPPSYVRLRLVSPGESRVYARAEFALETDGVFPNPFDPAQADLSVRFTAPGGRSVLVPAFWYQEYDRQTLTPRGSPGWRARFTPEQAGSWTAQAVLARPALRSEPLSFSVGPALDPRGFIAINPRNPRQFAYTDGSFFLPIGLNIAWAASLETTLSDYARQFGALSRSGGNFARLWMPSWGVGLEWKDTGLGNYSNRLFQAWLLDQVFDLAEEDGIQILLTLQNHGPFSKKANSEWADNPYNIANGGMLRDPGEFASDPLARELFQRRLRYIAARYSYSTHLFAWEWWNEVDWTPISDRALKPWLIEMTAYLHSVDPYRHLTTLSYARGASATLWNLPEIDFAQEHDYTGADPAVQFGISFAALSRRAPGKPAVLAECAASGDGPLDPGLEAIHLHSAIWAAPFSGYASTGMYWWWDSLIEPRDLWGEYRGLSQFLQGEDLALLQPGVITITPGARALALQSPDRALVWLTNPKYDGNGYRAAYRRAAFAKTLVAGWKFEPTALEGVTLMLSGLADGRYSADWYDPQEARWLRGGEPVTVRGGRAALKVPPFRYDLALRLAAADDPQAR